jgi:hypothetical protein
MRKIVWNRIIIGMILGILIAAVVSEVSFFLIGDKTSRAPKVVELVIPAGASEKVALGESVLPKEQNFVVGDTLVVKNEDSVAHVLGPLYIPAGSSARLKLTQPENLAYTCSFQPTKVFGLNVTEALTFGTRITGILIAGIPMGFLLALYSLVAWPLGPKLQATVP